MSPFPQGDENPTTNFSSHALAGLPAGVFFIVYKFGPRQLFESGRAVKNQQVNFAAIFKFAIYCIVSRAEKGCMFHQRADGPVSEIHDDGPLFEDGKKDSVMASGNG